MTDEDNAYQGKLLLIWFFTSCSFHSSTGAAQSMKFFPKKGINILNWLQNYDFQTDLTQLVLVIRSLTIDN